MTGMRPDASIEVLACGSCRRLPEVGGRCEECGALWGPDGFGTLQKMPSYEEIVETREALWRWQQAAEDACRENAKLRGGFRELTDFERSVMLQRSAVLTGLRRIRAEAETAYRLATGPWGRGEFLSTPSLEAVQVRHEWFAKHCRRILDDLDSMGSDE